MNSLFITGSTGFVGSHLIQRLSPDKYTCVYCLTRTLPDDLLTSHKFDNIQFIPGDLLDPESYSDHLEKCDTVIHLASVTGKAKSSQYFNVNTEGTRLLLEKCRQAGIKRFLYVSSIAVNFKNIENYPYAQSKFRAEEIVRAASIPYTIIRPTIVIGPGSPILINLIRLANAPIVPIFGDGSVKVQPIYIDDLISCILHIAQNSTFHNETLDIGGPDRVSIQDLLILLRKLSSGKNAKILRIPLRSIRKPLEIAETILLPVLPFTSGQLSMFAYDGTISKNHLFEDRAANMTRIDQMLKLAIAQMEEITPSFGRLERECERFTQYLAESKPDSYIIKKYSEGHKATTVEFKRNGFDKLLIGAANTNPFLTRLADAYTSVFCRTSVLRKKLVLLLAILEACPATYPTVDSPSESSIFSLYLNAGQRILTFILFLVTSCILFAPAHAVCSLFLTRSKKISEQWTRLLS